MATRLSQSSVKQLAVEAMDARNKLLRKPSSTAEIINNLLGAGLANLANLGIKPFFVGYFLGYTSSYRDLRVIQDYSPEDNHGIDYETAMGKIRAVMADGTIVTNVEAFSKLYEAVGLGWVYAITKYEPVATIADDVYGVWAKYRLQVTGRPPLEEVLEARRKKDEICNDNKSCKM
ncbi:thiol-disulfide oxidoreductase DCC [Artemisia annua]|uniref:Thiol-disulfide oxidoreductase DCC n=1 Tax=Artemisia annua TaxID=35608 RepID=A0A2U1MMF3_ARTAN|nr:thiol-disulfide oxidoreductase DCC [Artemisia annua]